MALCCRFYQRVALILFHLLLLDNIGILVWDQMCSFGFCSELAVRVLGNRAAAASFSASTVSDRLEVRDHNGEISDPETVEHTDPGAAVVGA